MNFRKPDKIVYVETEDKRWVDVYFGDIVWRPALIDLADILAKIGIVEDEKYNWPAKRVKGAEMVREFISQAIDLAIEQRDKLEILCEKYGIPPRGT